MSETYEFTVTIGTSDVVDDRKTAAELLQWATSGANQEHEHINYITVQHSELDAAELGRLFDLIHRFDDENIDDAISALDALEED